MTDDGETGKKIQFKITYYFCTRRFEGGCDQRVDSGQIISVDDQGNDMQTYHEAFKDANDGAPMCKIHDLQMMPQVRRLS